MSAVSFCTDIYSSAQVSTQVRTRSGFKNMETTGKRIYKNRKHTLQNKNQMHRKVKSVLSFIKPLKSEKKNPMQYIKTPFAATVNSSTLNLMFLVQIYVWISNSEKFN